MRYLPLAFDLKRRPCLIVGGGSIATRKARLLNKAEARLLVVAPEITDELRQLVLGSGGEYIVGRYHADLLKQADMVVAATNDASINATVSADAQALRLPVNVVDSPKHCTFTFPSIVERGPVSIGISSGGSAPVLTRMLRAQLETLLSPGLGLVAELAGRLRGKVKAALPEAQRKDFWHWVFNGPIVGQVERGDAANAEQTLLEELSRWEDRPAPSGEVYLIGGGPGDPDLLTFRALRLMQQADVVLYDRLVSTEVLELVRRDAERIYVGKKRQFHSVPQDDINQLLVDLAKEGKKVLRLKGGDPFIFGRGGEEIDRLAEAGVPFQVVPGITAAVGCSAYSGIPLTHRDHAQSVRFITGHLKEGDLVLPWRELVTPNQTIVFYMGLTGLPTIAQELIANGMDPETPAALVEKGTTREQRVVAGTIGTLPELAKTHNVEAPALTIIGGVVTLRDKLGWYK
ncbi:MULTISPECIES: siroheme synthase CysG [Microbulbifer]|uniref:Siroheme synthase n=1 Tax=Microbulbifer celer TaxID=435905 RepID=A0ABW3U7I4_9GAMM|nr:MULTISPECIES: siroheme synthase CysG [Microbulbifer]UFN58808.1 siroheme synthase CysG [Microbulbifer celer]